MIGEFLRRITSALEANRIPYMLTGSLASSMYGIPRATNDIDIVISPTRVQLLSIVQLFQRAGLTVTSEAAVSALRKRTQFNVIDFPHGLKADLIVQKDREFSAIEFERRETHEVEGMQLTIATPEDVLLAKLEWARMGDSERQIVDAAGILKVQGAALDTSYIEQWVKRLALEEQWIAA
ncbi:MAG TPA: hypothetical protein VF215_08570, partial [Thermoanaerobaculia bacterium]